MSIVGVTASSRRQVPNAPTIDTVTDVGTSRAYNNGAATITFTQSPVGFEATSFTATSSPGGYTATGASSPLTITGLQSNVAYTFTVTATNFVGTSSASSASNSITATTVPQAPTIGTPTLANGQAYTGSANIGVAFTANATGGKAITTFTATSSSTASVSGTSSPISVSETVGSARTYTVTASNANGTSLASSASTSITPSSVPQTPTLNSVTNVAGQPVNAPQASVAFTAGATGGSAITLFTVTSSSGATNTGASSPVVITESGAGTYTYTVVATNARGNSLASTGVSSNVSSVPSAPTIGTATNVTGIAYGSNPNITISFTANSAGGSPISSYKYSTNGGTTYATATGTSSPLTLTLQSTGVAFVAGSTYSVSLKAVNSSGDSAASATSNSVVASTKPQAPTVGTPTSASGQAFAATGSVSIPFTAGATGGSAITTFTVLSSSGATTTSATSPFTLSQNTGSSYTYTVTATNVNGVSAASAASASVLVATVPQAPTIGTLANVTGINNGSNPQFTLAFTAGGTGGSAITSYEYSTNGGTNWAAATGTTSPFTLTLQSTGSAFVAGTNYAAAIRAINAKGTSLASATSNSVTAATKPGAPTITLTNTASNIITVNYSYNTGGLNTTSSTSTLSPTIAATVGGTSSGAASGSYTLTASYLQGTAYSVTYAVTNAMGTSPNSNTPSTTPFAATVPSAPASLSAAVASSTSVTLTYGAISQNGSALTAWTGSGTSTGDIVSSPAVNLTYSGTPSTAGGTVTVTGTFAATTSYTFSLRARNSVGAGTTITSNGVVPLPSITDNFNRTGSALGTTSSGSAWNTPAGSWSTNGSLALAGSDNSLGSVAFGNTVATVTADAGTSSMAGYGVAYWISSGSSYYQSYYQTYTYSYTYNSGPAYCTNCVSYSCAQVPSTTTYAATATTTYGDYVYAGSATSYPSTVYGRNCTSGDVANPSSSCTAVGQCRSPDQATGTICLTQCDSGGVKASVTAGTCYLCSSGVNGPNPSTGSGSISSCYVQSSTTTYSCPSGGTLSGTTCTVTTYVSGGTWPSCSGATTTTYSACPNTPAQGCGGCTTNGGGGAYIQPTATGYATGHLIRTGANGGSLISSSDLGQSVSKITVVTSSGSSVTVTGFNSAGTQIYNSGAITPVATPTKVGNYGIFRGNSLNYDGVDNFSVS